MYRGDIFWCIKEYFWKRLNTESSLIFPSCASWKFIKWGIQVFRNTLLCIYSVLYGCYYLISKIIETLDVVENNVPFHLCVIWCFQVELEEIRWLCDSWQANFKFLPGIPYEFFIIHFTHSQFHLLNSSDLPKFTQWALAKIISSIIALNSSSPFAQPNTLMESPLLQLWSWSGRKRSLFTDNNYISGNPVDVNLDIDAVLSESVFVCSLGRG